MIRKATAADVAAITNIYNKIHDCEESGRMVVGWDRSVYPTEDTARGGVLDGSMFVLEEDEHIVAAGKINQEQLDAYALCDWEYPAADNEVMSMHTLVVDPECTGHGYARRFIEFYERYAREQGCSYLRIDTQEKNQAARAMYKKLGYREIGKVPTDFYGISQVSLVCLEKKA